MQMSECSCHHRDGEIREEIAAEIDAVVKQDVAKMIQQGTMPPFYFIDGMMKASIIVRQKDA
jgi:hypothetical protein